jgi:Membrane protein implicated in regulation of membrane protease activity
MSWYVWVILSILFFIVEIFTPGFFFFSVAVGLLNALIPLCFGLSIWWQLVFLIIGWTLSFLLLRPLLSGGKKPKETNVAALIGRKGVVTTDITPLEKGRVKLGSESWLATSLHPVEQGKTVVVKDIDGVTLMVEEVI